MKATMQRNHTLKLILSSLYLNNAKPTSSISFFPITTSPPWQGHQHKPTNHLTGSWWPEHHSNLNQTYPTTSSYTNHQQSHRRHVESWWTEQTLTISPNNPNQPCPWPWSSSSSSDVVVPSLVIYAKSNIFLSNLNSSLFIWLQIGVDGESCVLILKSCFSFVVRSCNEEDPKVWLYKVVSG